MKPGGRTNQTLCWLLAGLLPVLTGCQDIKENSVTGRLWSSDALITHREPATHPNLELFHDAYHADFLAAYDEANEKDGVLQRRAYFIRANEARVANIQKPRFVELRLAATLEPIPLESAPSPLNSPSGYRAQLAEDGRSFTLFQNGAEAGVYHLPTYADKGSEAKRVLMTPATVVADVVIGAAVVGAIVGVIVVYSYVENHSN